MVDNFIKSLRCSGKSPLVFVDVNDTVGEAKALMDDRDFSQIPVMKDKEIVGAVTYEVMLRWTSRIRWAKLEKLRVEEIMTDITVVDHGVDLFDILDILANKAYVIVKMDGWYEILTSYDALNYFRENSESFLILSDIENNLKEIIADCLDADEFKEAVKSCINEIKQRVPESVEDMTFGDYRNLILSNWLRFAHIFGNKIVFQGYIERCREIRNNNFHFRHVSSSDRVFLKDTLNWIKLKKDASKDFLSE